MDNPWPVVDKAVPSNDAMDYLNETTKIIKDMYNGKLQSSISKVTYVLSGFNRSAELIKGMKYLVGTEKNDPEYKEQKNIEEGREPAYISQNNYKYEIYNDHLYYKLFVLKLSEFYPISIVVSAGILDKEETEISVHNIDSLQQIFKKIVQSEKVIAIIKKMLL